MLLLYLPYRTLSMLEVGIFMKTFFYVEFIVDLFSVPLSYFLLQLKEKKTL